MPPLGETNSLVCHCCVPEIQIARLRPSFTSFPHLGPRFSGRCWAAFVLEGKTRLNSIIGIGACSSRRQKTVVRETFDQMSIYRGWLMLDSRQHLRFAMGREFEEFSSTSVPQEDLCFLPSAALLGATDKRGSNLAIRQRTFKFRKYVANICEAPVYVKSFIRQRTRKNSKFVYTTLPERRSLQRKARGPSPYAADTGSSVQGHSALTRRSKLLYFV